MKALRVDIWSDVACPWCFIAKRRLEHALRQFERPVDVVWRAFELNPTAPPDPSPSIPYVDRLTRKYGVSRREAQAMIDRMAGVGQGVDIPFRFDRVVPANTFDAHRLLAWARDTSDRQTALKERLFQAYMLEGRHLGQRAALAELAEEAGMDRSESEGILDSDAYAEQVRSDEVEAHTRGVSGVPFFLFGGRSAVGGAQTADILLGTLRQLNEPTSKSRPVGG